MKEITTLKNRNTKKFVDVWYLALKEVTQEELDEISRQENTEVVIKELKSPKKDFTSYSKTAKYLDYENDKYRYFNIFENKKRSWYCSSYNVRVAR